MATVRKANTWQQALKKFNETTENWVIPKAGTPAYAKVKKIQAKLNKAESSTSKPAAGAGEQLPAKKTKAKVKKAKQKKAPVPEPDTVSDEESSDLE